LPTSKSLSDQFFCIDPCKSYCYDDFVTIKNNFTGYKIILLHLDDKFQLGKGG